MNPGPDTRVLVPGQARGRLVVLDEPLSFWGGLDPHTGEVIDRHHPQSGSNISGCVLAMPSGRGSSSASSVLAEAIRAGTAPVAILLLETDPIVALGALVAKELYQVSVPVVVLGRPAYDSLVPGTELTLDASGHGVSFS